MKRSRGSPPLVLFLHPAFSHIWVGRPYELRGVSGYFLFFFFLRWFGTPGDEGCSDRGASGGGGAGSSALARRLGDTALGD